MCTDILSTYFNILVCDEKSIYFKICFQSQLGNIFFHIKNSVLRMKAMWIFFIHKCHQFAFLISVLIWIQPTIGAPTFHNLTSAWYCPFFFPFIILLNKPCFLSSFLFTHTSFFMKSYNSCQYKIHLISILIVKP